MEQDRRRFLKSAGKAAFSGSLFTGDVRGAALFLPNDRVNLAFIGMGRTGSRNLGYAGRTPGVNVAAVCDVSQPARDRAIAQAKKLGFSGVKAGEDFREILADRSIDAVCIATPTRWRAYIAMEACKAGKDVWVEAPACEYVDDGVKMAQAARQYRRVVQAGTVQRSGSYFRRAREMVKSGELGDVTYCRAFQMGHDWNAMADWGVHLLDIVQFAFDEAMPLSAAAQGNSDTVQATYRYPGFVVGYEARIIDTHLPGGAVSGVAFHGDKATLTVNRSGYRLYRNGETVRLADESWDDSADMSMTHWANFLECIRHRGKPASEIETCVRSTTTCLLANLACRHSTTLDWDDKRFTVKQSEIEPFLRARDRAPWRVDA